MTEMKKIIILCVNYNSYDSLNHYLASINEAFLETKNKFLLSVYIGDNSLNSQKISDDYAFDVRHYVSGDNLGYFGGVEYAIKQSNVDLSEFDYIIISNVDLTIDKKFFDELLKADTDECVGCIAPSIFSLSDNRDRNPKIISRPGKKKLVVQRLLYRYPILDRIYVSFFYAKRRLKLQNHSEGYIYAAHGSFIVFTNKFANFLQAMDYPCFLFGEEIYLAEHLRKLGLKTFYNPMLKVYDTDHVSTSKMKSKAYYHYNYKSIDMLLKEFFYE